MKQALSKYPYSPGSMALMEQLKHRILVLDGAMGTMIQRYGLDEHDFHSGCHCGCETGKALKGCNDILSITRPDIIEDIHRQYLEAGADIVTTNTFNANAISLADYDMQSKVREINFTAARLTRKVADEYSEKTGKKCFVAGSIGPTSKSLTMSANLGDNITFDEMAEAYFVQCKALINGGVDMFAFETFYDTLNCKAAIYGALRAMEAESARVPMMISATLTMSGQTLSGMSLKAFVTAVSHAEPIAVGINCGFGAKALAEHLSEIDDYTGCVVFYPNAGLPNELGEYDQTPEQMAEEIRSSGVLHRVNIIGGCCGTTPEHIAAISSLVKEYVPRKTKAPTTSLKVAGLQPLDYDDYAFVNVGERCNVAGSRKFLRLINENNFDEALSVAASQIEKGANIIDINMDDGLLDTKACMVNFLTKIATEPSIAKVPVMVDSSDFDVIKEALKHIQGRPIVNSISLKEGEEAFVSHARTIYALGAAMVVMAFDENGQATTVERRIEVCSRAYNLLTNAGIPACDIIFDPNILAVATGLEEHDSYAADFLVAAKWIHENLPHANISGGLSNLSFSFRGNDYVRNVMHSLFISDAKKAGMKMAIVNPSGIIPEETIPEDLKKAVNDVLENTDRGATFRLVDIAPKYMAAKKTAVQKAVVAATPESHLADALVTGNTVGIEDDIRALLEKGMSAISIIENILMGAMNVVGERFGKGEMFLPQVVKSASVMKAAVEILTPEIEKGKQNRTDSAYKMVLATVKGDVHDIGKNIVAVVLRCNGFKIIDLGVMTPAEKIIETAVETGADAIGLSGLITPSLAEMVTVARLMQECGLKIPLFIGGATTSEMHTALKIAPEYSFPVVHTYDAAQLAAESKKYLNKATATDAAKSIAEHHQSLRNEHNNKVSEHMVQLTLEEARRKKAKLTFEPYKCDEKRFEKNVNITEIRESINWKQFLHAWQLNPAEAVLPENERSEHVQKVLDDANRLLNSMEQDGVCLRFAYVSGDAYSSEDNIYFFDNKGDRIKLPMLRQTEVLKGNNSLCLADFVPEKDENIPYSIFIFAATVTAEVYNKYVTDSTSYEGILADLLLSRLAEAATEYCHKKYCHPGSNSCGIRPAVGYPSMPDQSLVKVLDNIIDYSSLGITITENGALFPSATTTGIVFVHPEAKYFAVGTISDEQRADYALRRGLSAEELDKFLP